MIEHGLEHWDAMVAAARRVLGCRDAADDCAAEALVQYLEMHPMDVANLRAFLVAIAHRRAVDAVRRAERARRRGQLVAGRLVMDVHDVAEDVAAQDEASWVDRQARRLLRPRVYVLVRLVADGVEIEEAARRLGMTRDAAASHLKRARFTLRSALAKTLLGIGAIGAGLRRLLLPATTTATAATVAVAALLAIVVEQATPAGESPGFALAPLTRPVPPSAARATSASPSPRGVRLEAAKGRAGFNGRPSAEEVIRVQTPAAGVGLEKRDDGRDSGDYVSRMVACVHELRAEPNYLGC